MILLNYNHFLLSRSQWIKIICNSYGSFYLYINCRLNFSVFKGKLLMMSANNEWFFDSWSKYYISFC